MKRSLISISLKYCLSAGFHALLSVTSSQMDHPLHTDNNPSPASILLIDPQPSCHWPVNLLAKPIAKETTSILYHSQLSSWTPPKSRDVKTDYFFSANLISGWGITQVARTMSCR